MKAGKPPRFEVINESGPTFRDGIGGVPELFRLEAVEGNSAVRLGEIKISRPLSFSVIAIVCLLLLSVCISYLYLGEFSRKTRVSGFVTLAEGVVLVSPISGGTLTEILVQEGQVVKVGQPLARIRVDTEGEHGSTALLARQLRLKREHELDREMVFLKQSLLEIERNKDMDASIAQSEKSTIIEEIDAFRRRLIIERESLSRIEGLNKEGFVSWVQLQQKQADLLDLMGKEKELERGLVMLDRQKLNSLSLYAERRISLLSRVFQIEKEMVALRDEDLQHSSRELVVVTAPTGGAVGAIFQQVGQTIQAGVNILSIAAANRSGAAKSQLEVHLYAPSRSSGFLKTGAAVRLQFPAFPPQKFGALSGEIVAVSNAPTPAQDLPVAQQHYLAQDGKGEAMYRIRVKPASEVVVANGEPKKLLVGMLVEAELIHERRAIWEWLFEPLLAATSSA